MKMTFDEYDEFCENLANIGYSNHDWWPTPEEIDIHTENGKYLEDHIKFLISIVETNNPPETHEEIESRNYINKILRENLILVDNDEEEVSSTASSSSNSEFADHEASLAEASKQFHTENELNDLMSETTVPVSSNSNPEKTSDTSMVFSDDDLF